MNINYKYESLSIIVDVIHDLYLKTDTVIIDKVNDYYLLYIDYKSVDIFKRNQINGLYRAALLRNPTTDSTTKLKIMKEVEKQVINMFDNSNIDNYFSISFTNQSHILID